MKRISTLDNQGEASKHRKVSYSTFQKWKTELDKECNTLPWLECETSGVGSKKSVVKLKCMVCVQFQSKIEGRNYSDMWVSVANSICTSNIKDHSRSEQHAHAMMLPKRSLGQDPCLYAPIDDV